jgi:hypothetical protein
MPSVLDRSSCFPVIVTSQLYPQDLSTENLAARWLKQSLIVPLLALVGVSIQSVLLSHSTQKQYQFKAVPMFFGFGLRGISAAAHCYLPP